MKMPSMILPIWSRIASYRSMKNIPRSMILVAQMIDPIILYIQKFCSLMPDPPAMNGTTERVRLWNFPRTIYQNPYFSICPSSM